MNIPPIETLIPHDAPMILIDALVKSDESTSTSELCIRESLPFFDATLNGVPSWVGVEYMAQTVAAHSGFTGLKKNDSSHTPPIGFLLGTRKYISSTAVFKQGITLETRVDMLFNDNGMASFNCSISEKGGEVLCTAKLTTYEPPAAELTLILNKLRRN